MSRTRVIVVAKRTAFRRFIEEECDPRAAALIRQNDPSVARWKTAHDEHGKTLDVVHQALAELDVRVHTVLGPRVAFDAGDARLVVTVGGDGTLLAASHHVVDIPVLGVNSAPGHSVGFFCAARPDTVSGMLRRALADEIGGVELSRMEVSVNQRVHSRRVLNEALFCHSIPAATSRYFLKVGRQHEEQRSSGVWVGSAAGSTGAILSAGGDVLPFTSKDLQYVVREPYVGFGAPCRMPRGRVGPRGAIRFTSKMDDARVFLDGPFKTIPVRLGDEVSMRRSRESLTVLGLHPERVPQSRPRKR